MKPVRWRIYVRGRQLGDPSTLVGTATAPTKSEALSDAQLKHFGKVVEVVSEIAWDAMGTRDRAVFEGTHRIPDEDKHPNIRTAHCLRCGSDILYGRDRAGKWRNPPIRCLGPGCEPKKTPKFRESPTPQ